MYLGVDIGGTKVLMAAFTDSGKPVATFKFPTPKTYTGFLSQFTENLVRLGNHDYVAAGVAIPGVVDRKNGIGIRFGNLKWKNVPIRKDLEQVLNCAVSLENDAKAGAIYEAFNVRKEFKNVLYIAIGTGIGIAYVSSGILDTQFGDRGGNRLLIERNGTLVSWESLASGHAIVERFGKKASEITDAKTWKTIAHDISLGVLDLIAVFDTDVIVFGGGVGAHFDQFKTFLKQELDAYATPLQPVPNMIVAKHAEEAVIYGCFRLAKEIHAKITH